MSYSSRAKRRLAVLGALLCFSAPAVMSRASAQTARVEGQLDQGSARLADIGAVSPMCFIRASIRQHLPLSVLLALMKTEGGSSGVEHRNKDGSHDLGVMQVNDSFWLPRIAAMQFGGDLAAARRAVRDNGCYNVNVGAWIYRQALDEAHGDTVKAVGFYNTHTPDKMYVYQKRVAVNFARVLATFQHYNLTHLQGGDSAAQKTVYGG